MAFSYSPKIVTEGLVLYLDAANRDSYPGSGTVWNDISRGGNNGTLTNGPTFNSGNGGSIVFDGSNDYIQIPSSSLFNFCNSTNDLPFSVSVWCYVNSLSTAFYLYNKGDNGNGVLESYASSINTGGYFTVSLYDTIGSNQSILTTTSILPTQTWINLTSTYSGTGGNNGTKLYYNGVQQTTTTSSIGTYSRMRVQNTDLFLGSFGNTGTFRSIQSNGRYSSFTFYNKELSSQEVHQNYNANKGRFNL